MPESCQLSHKSDRTFSSEPGEGLRVTHDCLDVGHELVKVDECQLSLHVGILAQMASGVAKCTGLTAIKKDWLIGEPVFCTETLLNAEDIPQRWKTCFQV